MSLVAQTPENWTRASVGKYCDVQLGKMLQNIPSSELDELKPYLRAINIGKEGLDLGQEFRMWIRPQETDRFRLTKGDILVSEGGDAGRVAIFDANGEYYFQNAINRVRPDYRSKIEPHFIYYWFTFLKAAGYVEKVCNVATIPHFTAEKVKAAPLALPPLSTQRRIAWFLDEKTARIDGLIEKKWELLDRLAEKRQALITRAVTKGLNPDAGGMTKVPDRVREAYRELPSGWKVEKLKFFANIRNSNVDKTVSEDEKPVRLCNYTDVYYHDRITADLDFIDGSATEAEIERFQLKSGQVIITKDSEAWDDIGIPAFVTEDMSDVLCGYHLSVFEPGQELDGGFLAWLCRAEPLNDQFKLAANGVTRYGLGQYPMKNALIALPPLDTQRRIARFLDEKTARIDAIASQVRCSIEYLREYRSALITATVTGQLTGLR